MAGNYSFSGDGRVSDNDVFVGLDEMFVDRYLVRSRSRSCSW